MKVTWTEAKGVITGYRVHCVEESSDFDYHCDVNKDELSYILQDLRPGTEYIISVSGLNGATESQPVPFGGLSCQTKPSLPTEEMPVEIIPNHETEYKVQLFNYFDT